MRENRPVYIAGDMLTRGSILLREEEKRLLNEAGIKTHSPIDDKEINDKSKQTIESNNNLAERIVRKDTDAIKRATHILIEPQSFAQGTLVELGQIKGYNDVIEDLEYILGRTDNFEQMIEDIHYYISEINPKKKVYAHLQDIRRTNIPETGDRRSFGINQYIHGVVLDLTDGVGFREMDEIIEEIKKDIE